MEERAVRKRLARNGVATFMAMALASVGAVTAQAKSPVPDALPSTGCDQASTEPMPEILAVPSGGVDREALIHVPPAAAEHPSAPLPVVLAFHGYTAGPYDQEWISGLSALADAEGFVAA
jgi:poly(3-hydroxybutyrate) depolymerase